MNKQTARLLEQHFDTAFAAPDGIARLRELILTLAMQGRLVEQDPSDPPASELLKEIQAEKQRLVKAGTFRDNKKLSNGDSCPFTLPQGWKWASVQQLGFLLGGKRLPKGHAYSKTPTNYRYLTVTNMKNGTIIDNDVKYITKETHEAIKNYLVSKDEIYITIAGTIGAVGIIPEHCDGMNLTENASRLVFWGCDKLFLIHMLNSGIVQAQFSALTNKMAQPKLSLRSILSTGVPIPPFSEQHRIVARIEQLMARCDELETLRKEREEKRLAIHAAAINRLLDAPDGSVWNFIQQHFCDLYTVKENVAELRKAILQLAVMGKLVPQNPDDPPARELLKEIKAEKLRLVKAGKIKKSKPLPPIKPEEVPYELPKGWEWVRLGEIGIINPRNNAEDSAKAGFIPMSMIPEGFSEKHQFEERPWNEIKKGYTHFADGDVGMAKITPCFENAKSCIFSNLPNGIGAGTTELHIFRNTFKAVVPRFLLYFLKNPRRIYRAVSKMTGSAGQKRVPTLYFTEELFPLSPIKEQHRIVARVDQLMALCDTLEEQIDAATSKQSKILNAVMARIGGQ